jgi:hypothetical protein
MGSVVCYEKLLQKYGYYQQEYHANYIVAEKAMIEANDYNALMSVTCCHHLDVYAALIMTHERVLKEGS